MTILSVLFDYIYRIIYLNDHFDAYSMMFSLNILGNYFLIW